MSNFTKSLIFFALSMLATACGGDKGFTIDCEIKGLDNRGVEMVYATPRGLSHTTHHPEGDRLELHGESSALTPVELFSMDGELIASLVAQNGDKIKLNMTLGDPRSLRVTGQEASRDYSAFITEHDSLLTVGGREEINSLIADYVRANPKSVASTMLLVNRFVTDGYELLADSLLSGLDAKARPALLTGGWAKALGEQVSIGARKDLKMFTLRVARDTFARFTPSLQGFALLAFNEDAKPDSTRERLQAMRSDMSKRRLMMMEISLASDSATWRSHIDKDSMKIDARWIQAWAPGGVASSQIRRLAVARVPYYIVADSSATVRYRGSSLAEADSLLRSLILPPPVAETDSL